jgi:hypothetical protein
VRQQQRRLLRPPFCARARPRLDLCPHALFPRPHARTRSWTAAYMVYVRPGATLASFELLDKESGGVDASTISPELAAAALARMNSGKGASPPRWCSRSSGVFCARPFAPARAPALTFALTHFFHAHTHALALWTAANLCTADGCDCTAAVPGGSSCKCAASGHEHVKSSSAAGASAAAASFAHALLSQRARPALSSAPTHSHFSPTRPRALLDCRRAAGRWRCLH